jgi:hypothetical protein
MVDSGLWEVQNLIVDLRWNGQPDWDESVIRPIVEQRPTILAFLHDVGRPEARGPLPGGDENLWDLYVLSRLTDILIAPHQPVNDDPALIAWTTKEPWWSGPLPSRSAWSATIAALGATRIAEDAFHPFFHEIVAVEPADDPDEEPSLVAEHWPGALIGSLLLTRSGVTVRAGRHRLDPEVAARSCLYWGWYRRNRIVRDLSHGWGQNSQWRTDFRRDYVTPEALYYNVDAHVERLSPADDDEDLTGSDREDLVRFRHGRLRDLGTDRWPYYDRVVEPRE